MAEDLHAVLTARIDKLESGVNALRSIVRAPWQAGTGHVYTTDRGWWIVNGLAPELAAHIAANASPEAVLRGLAEDRDILLRHHLAETIAEPSCAWCEDRRYSRAWSYPCPDVVSLARRHGIEVPDHV